MNTNTMFLEPPAGVEPDDERAARSANAARLSAELPADSTVSPKLRRRLERRLRDAELLLAAPAGYSRRDRERFATSLLQKEIDHTRYRYDGSVKEAGPILRIGAPTTKESRDESRGNAARTAQATPGRTQRGRRKQ